MARPFVKGWRLAPQHRAASQPLPDRARPDRSDFLQRLRTRRRCIDSFERRHMLEQHRCQFARHAHARNDDRAHAAALSHRAKGFAGRRTRAPRRGSSRSRRGKTSPVARDACAARPRAQAQIIGGFIGGIFDDDDDDDKRRRQSDPASRRANAGARGKRLASNMRSSRAIVSDSKWRHLQRFRAPVLVIQRGDQARPAGTSRHDAFFRLRWRAADGGALPSAFARAPLPTCGAWCR